MAGWEGQRNETNGCCGGLEEGVWCRKNKLRGVGRSVVVVVSCAVE